jgi:Recombination endonuclease VII
MLKVISGAELPKRKRAGNKHNVQKQNAIKNGDKYYYTGKHCRNGHLAYRYVANSMCSECSKNHKLDNMEAAKTTELRKYGITAKDYNKLLWLQNSLCAICKQKETRTIKGGKISALAVDHCHDTKLVRGLLCYACNVGIGFFKHNSEVLRNAALYCEATK